MRFAKTVTRLVTGPGAASSELATVRHRQSLASLGRRAHAKFSFCYGCDEEAALWRKLSLCISLVFRIMCVGDLRWIERSDRPFMQVIPASQYSPPRFTRDHEAVAELCSLKRSDPSLSRTNCVPSFLDRLQRSRRFLDLDRAVCLTYAHSHLRASGSTFQGSPWFRPSTISTAQVLARHYSFNKPGVVQLCCVVSQR